MLKVQELERHVLRVPGNGISDTGVDKICRLLQAHGVKTLSKSTKDWEWAWRVGGKGEYVGVLSKRVCKWVYQKEGIKLSPEVASEIGTLGNDHCDKAQDYYFDFTQKFDWHRGDFGDEGSCFLDGGGHSGAVPIMKREGVWAIRFYNSDTYHSGIARAWIVDCDKFCIVLNGYWYADGSSQSNHGTTQTLKIARVLAQFLDNAYYHKIELYAERPMYINGSIGFAIGPQEVVASMTSHSLDWDCAMRHECLCCEEDVSESEGVMVGDGWVCRSCYESNYFTCDSCGNVFHDDDCSCHNEHGYCRDCYDEKFSKCSHCHEFYEKSDITEIDGWMGCKDCRDVRYTQCSECDLWVVNEDLKEDDDEDPLCGSCFERLGAECPECGEFRRKPILGSYVTDNDGWYFKALGQGVANSKKEAHLYNEAELQECKRKNLLVSPFVVVSFYSDPVPCPHCHAV